MIERLEEISYPVEANGVPVDPRELYDLSTSILNLDKPKNWNRHHEFWIASDYTQHLYFCLRCLVKYQIHLPVDIHDSLHRDWEPPAKPRPQQAYELLEQAVENGDQILPKSKKKNIGSTALRVITAEDLLKCKASCDSLMRRWA